MYDEKYKIIMWNKKNSQEIYGLVIIKFLLNFN